MRADRLRANLPYCCTCFRNPGLRQTELVEATGIDRSTLTEILRRLANRGQIVRSRRETDQRANALRITPEGEVVLLSAFEAAERAQQRILEPIDEAEKENAMTLLARLAGYGR